MSKIEFIYFSDEWNQEKSREDRAGKIQPEGAESASAAKDDSKGPW